MKKNLLHKVKFNLIRYSNCWEDADILLEALSISKGAKILSVAAAGDNSFSMLITEPELLVAMDINPIQLHLVELKKEIIKKLDHEDALEFLGFKESNNRSQVFATICTDLSEEALLYWQSNMNLIEAGVIYCGKFEKYFRLFSWKVLPLIHSRKKADQLMTPKSTDEQVCFYKSWNTYRWRMLFKIFFSRLVMGRLGRDIEFMKQVNIPVSQTIFSRAAKHLASFNAQNNFILYFILKGNFNTLLPHYMRKENFYIIKSNISKLVIRQGYIQDAIGEFGKFSAMNLSNIFEYMDTYHFRQTLEILINGLEKNGRLGYWNLLVPRKAADIFPGKLNYLRELSELLTKKDKGFFYDQFYVDELL